jgi:tetratricopeptide (TPR) repeat protein
MSYRSGLFFNLIIMAMLCCCKGSLAQTIPDSLIQQFNRSNNDSLKARLLLSMGETVEIAAPEKSMALYKNALQLGRKINNNDNIFLAWINIANCHIELNKMDSAILGFQQAIDVARLMKDSVKVARGFGNMGNVYLHKNDRVKALEYYLYAAKLWEASTDQQYLPILYNNINALLEEQKESTQAVVFANKAIAMATKLGDSLSLVDGLVNLAVSYNHLAQYDKAYELLLTTLPMAKTIGDNYQLVTIYNNMGDYFMQKQNFHAALDQYEEMYTHAKEIGNQFYLNNATLALAKVHRRLKNNEKALHW